MHSIVLTAVIFLRIEGNSIAGSCISADLGTEHSVLRLISVYSPQIATSATVFVEGLCFALLEARTPLHRAHHGPDRGSLCRKIGKNDVIKKVCSFEANWSLAY